MPAPVPALHEFHWRCVDAAGGLVSDADEVFIEQQSAEMWLQLNFEELAETGVDAVTLMQGADVVYGPMSLGPG